VLAGSRTALVLGRRPATLDQRAGGPEVPSRRTAHALAPPRLLRARARTLERDGGDRGDERARGRRGDGGECARTAPPRGAAGVGTHRTRRVGVAGRHGAVSR